MTDNYDSGFDLVLSDYERRDLIAHYETDALPDYQSCNDDDMWYGYQIGGRMFDLNVFKDYITENIVCVIYECDWIRGRYACPLPWLDDQRQCCALR